MRRQAAWSVLVTIAFIACRGDSTSPKPAPSLKILSGPIGTDTILGIVLELLRVEVRDSSGQIAPGVNVQFRIALPAGETQESLRGAYACVPWLSACADVLPSQSTIYTQVDVITDASGVASARIQHGMRATSGVIQVSAPSLNVSSATTYTTVPGGLAGFVATASDTSVYVGKSYALSAQAADRFGNTRADAVTIEALTPDIASFANGQVTGRAIGRGSFALRAGALSQTAYVSVPPQGRLVASVRSSAAGLDLTLLDTDGGTRRMFASTQGHVGFAFPAWHIDGHRVTVLESGVDGRGRVIAYDTATGARSAPIDTLAFPETTEPSYPRSGNAMYFYGTRSNGERGVFRANVDGSNAQLVLNGFWGVISPDESVLLIGTSTGLVQHNLATGAETPFAATNYTPFWSPAGDVVAYLVTGVEYGFDLHVVRRDGSGDRVLTTGVYDARSFSPDGAWIAVSRAIGGGVELVRVSDGLRLPVPTPRPVSHVAWRRE